MFPDGIPDMEGLLQQAQQMQQDLVETQQELEQTHVEGSAGGNLVTATVTGTGDLIGVTISPQACDPDDTDSLADLVVAAVRDATTKAHEMARQRLGPLAGGPGGAPTVGKEVDEGIPGQLGSGDAPDGGSPLGF